jgi:hypothetical protein
MTSETRPRTGAELLAELLEDDHNQQPGEGGQGACLSDEQALSAA